MSRFQKQYLSYISIYISYNDDTFIFIITTRPHVIYNILILNNQISIPLKQHFYFILIEIFSKILE